MIAEKVGHTDNKKYYQFTELSWFVFLKNQNIVLSTWIMMKLTNKHKC